MSEENESTTSIEPSTTDDRSDGEFSSPNPSTSQTVSQVTSEPPKTFLKIIIIGPPLSGKTTIAKSFEKIYNLFYVDLKQLIESIVTPSSSPKDNQSTSTEATESDITATDRNEDIRGKLAEIIASDECQEKSGIIIDNFSLNYLDSAEIFLELKSTDVTDVSTVSEEYEEEDEELKQNLKPDLLIVLEANSEVLANRALNFTESQAILHNCTELVFVERLNEYDDLNEDEFSTFIELLDETKIPVIKIEQTESTDHDTILKLIGQTISDRYKVLHDRMEIVKITTEQTIQDLELRKQQEQAERIKEVLEVKKQREIKLQNWTDKFMQMKMEEQELIEVESLPLREYLVRFILPTLVQGLSEVAKVKPDDPVDYLAEFLFKTNANEYGTDQNMRIPKDVENFLFNELFSQDSDDF